MAGARDIARQTIAIRREQALRNAEATAEKEARLNEMDEVANMHPSARRRHLLRRPLTRTVTIRDGHRVAFRELLAPDLVPVFDSQETAALAYELGVYTREAFVGYEPGSDTGYTATDVVRVADDLAEREAKMDDRGYQNKMLQDKGVEDKGEDEVNEED